MKPPDPGLFLLESFLLLTQYPYLLLVLLNFLLIFDSILADHIFIGISSFILGCQDLLIVSRRIEVALNR